MKFTVFLLSAFGENKDGGNLAGVVLNADSLTDTQKKIIAKDVGFSETAFVQKSDKADFKVTFFTPTDEVDLCGHATIATYALLLQKEIIKPKEYKQELKVGVLRVLVSSDGMVTMDQSLPEYGKIFQFDDIVHVFTNNQKISTISGLPTQIVSTGIHDIFLPIQTSRILNTLVPDFERMKLLSKQTDSVSIHAFTLDVESDFVAESRNFAPLFGINEEAATGSSTGALASYLYKYDKLATENLAHLVFKQGTALNKPSQIIASLSVHGKSIQRVQVGGKAQLFGEKEVII